MVDSVGDHALDQRRRSLWGKIGVYRAIETRFRESLLGNGDHANERTADLRVVFRKKSLIADDQDVLQLQGCFLLHALYLIKGDPAEALHHPQGALRHVVTGKGD